MTTHDDLDAPTIDTTDEPDTDMTIDTDSAPDGAEEAVAIERPEATERTPRRTRRRTVVLTGGAGAVVVALGATSLYFHLEHRDSAAVAASRADVMTAATDGTRAVLTYRAGSVDADLARAATFLTGDFRDYYTKLGTDAIAPNARSRGLSSEAAVAGTSTIRVDQGSAGALVFVNQSVTPASGAASVTSTAIRVHLTEVDGRWLIDRFEPI
ncbi:hypothetical protein [Williamsia herbipolensis]|uniref:hypothetical protein n=1 Tax=Williamsia herbipolensis TaxID=1603258 RepID=UPI000697B727|nr:hypothetical protein [Williamsia herbipolensis]